ncbi:MAG: hypothetical protein KDA60_07375 [Planctomycetales bacterium]|nr:hypothetical protein [Planctomycetales bacterium]
MPFTLGLRELLLATSIASSLSVYSCSPVWAENDAIAPALQAIRSVGPEGQGNEKAQAAWAQVVKQASASDIPQVLAAMRDTGPISTNWLRAAVDAIAQRARRSQQSLPQQSLEEFLADASQAPRARRTAYELLRAIDPEMERRILPSMLNDASLDMRRDAVTTVLEQARMFAKNDQRDAAIKSYRAAFDAARDLDQVKEAAKELRELDQEADVTKHYGFVLDWQLIGPFDNTGTQGFDVAYPPEAKISLGESVQGKEGQVAWKQHTTDDEFGVVDLNKAIGKHMGAIAYAYAEFTSPVARDVEFRLGCINGNKLWVNGQEVISNHVYHAGMEVDQYAATAPLHPGKNTILLKIAQNEQTEDWAQNWQFQLRVCDALGTAIASGSQ